MNDATQHMNYTASASNTVEVDVIDSVSSHNCVSQADLQYKFDLIVSGKVPCKRGRAKTKVAKERFTVYSPRHQKKATRLAQLAIHYANENGNTLEALDGALNEIINMRAYLPIGAEKHAVIQFLNHHTPLQKFVKLKSLATRHPNLSIKARYAQPSL